MKRKRIDRLNKRSMLIRSAHKRAVSREDWRTVGKLEDQHGVISIEMQKLLKGDQVK